MSAPKMSNSTCSEEKQSVKCPTSFIQSERRTAFSGDLTCQAVKWTWTGSHDSCVSATCCLQITSEGWETWESDHDSCPGHLYDSWEPPHTLLHPVHIDCIHRFFRVTPLFPSCSEMELVKAHFRFVQFIQYSVILLCVKCSLRTS